MTIQMAYQEFLNLVNRNATNNRTNVDRIRFVMLFNSVQDKYVEWSLDKRNEDSIRNIQKILVKDLELQESGSTDNHTTYKLPENFFDFSNLYATAKNDCCPAQRMLMHEEKSEDVEEKINDSNNSPSFGYRDSFFYHSSDNLVLFKKDFEYEEVILTYYRYPVRVDISGYTNIDGNPSIDIDPEFDDKVVRRILLGMSVEFSAINADPTAYQMDKDRLFTM